MLRFFRKTGTSAQINQETKGAHLAEFAMACATEKSKNKYKNYRKKLNEEMCWNAVVLCARLSKVINEEESKKLKPQNGIEYKMYSNFVDPEKDTLVRNVEEMVKVPKGSFIGFFETLSKEEEHQSIKLKAGDKILIHAMLAVGDGKAAGNKNSCIGIGSFVGWEILNLAGDLRWMEGDNCFDAVPRDHVHKNPQNPYIREIQIFYRRKRRPYINVNDPFKASGLSSWGWNELEKKLRDEDNEAFNKVLDLTEKNNELVKEVVEQIGKQFSWFREEKGIWIGEEANHNQITKLEDISKSIDLILNLEVDRLIRTRKIIDALTSEDLDNILTDKAMDIKEYGGEEKDDNLTLASKWLISCSNSLKEEKNIEKVRSLISDNKNSNLIISEIDKLWKQLVPKPEKETRAPSTSGAEYPCDKLGHTSIEYALKKLDKIKSTLGKALYLMASILRSHGYPDGNGRIARFIFAIVQLQNLPDKPTIKDTWVEVRHTVHEKKKIISNQFIAPSPGVTNELWNPNFRNDLVEDSNETEL